MYPSHSFVTIAMFSCLKTPFITEQCISQRDVHFIKLSQLMQRLRGREGTRDRGKYFYPLRGHWLLPAKA